MNFNIDITKGQLIFVAVVCIPILIGVIKLLEYMSSILKI